MIDPISSSVASLQNLRPPAEFKPITIGPARVGETLGGGAAAPAGGGSFSDLVSGLVRGVDGKSKAADAEVRSLMTGESDNIHRSMIAMQESGVAFTLLVEVRNKLVESYQELMRMPV